MSNYTYTPVSIPAANVPETIEEMQKVIRDRLSSFVGAPATSESYHQVRCVVDSYLNDCKRLGLLSERAYAVVEVGRDIMVTFKDPDNE